MKRNLIIAALLIGTSWGVMGQNPAQTTEANSGISSKADQNATGSADGLKRRGTGQESPKMKQGVSRRGNSNLSPTGPTNTQGSTSEGSASVPSRGGASGTNMREARGGVKGSLNSKNNTASDMGMTGRNGSMNSNGRSKSNTEVSTSGATGGSKRPTSTEAVRKESRTNDRNVGTGYPEPTGPGKPGTPAGNAKKSKTGSN